MYDRPIGQFMNPHLVTSHFHVREGDVVADFGSGSGHFLKPLSEAVGKTGVVYACEVQKSLIEALGIHVRTHKLHNVHVVWGDIEVLGGTKLKDASLDSIVLSNTLFQIADKTNLLAEISRTLRVGGTLFCIDWSDSFSGLGPRPEEVVTEAKARTLVESAGYTCERSFPAGEHHYGLAFRKK